MCRIIARSSKIFADANKNRSRFPLAVCSWSLRPKDAAALRSDLDDTGLAAVQLHLNPIYQGTWSDGSARAALQGVSIASGMMSTLGEDYSTLDSIRRTGGVRSDETWSANRHLAERVAGVCEVWRIGLVSLHAGFVPTGGEHGVMVERIAWLAACFGGVGTGLALETGQESAATLVEFLKDLDRATDANGSPRVGINFDPANMILYGMGDPVAALRELRPRVVQVHVKDALPSRVPGEWGLETVVGEGAVDWPAFFDVLALGGVPQLVIEREGGEARVADVRKAAEVVSRHVSFEG